MVCDIAFLHKPTLQNIVEHGTKISKKKLFLIHFVVSIVVISTIAIPHKQTSESNL